MYAAEFMCMVNCRSQTSSCIPRNSSDNLPCNHHSSDVINWRRGAYM